MNNDNDGCYLGGLIAFILIGFIISIFTNNAFRIVFGILVVVAIIAYVVFSYFSIKSKQRKTRILLLKELKDKYLNRISTMEQCLHWQVLSSSDEDEIWDDTRKDKGEGSLEYDYNVILNIYTETKANYKLTQTEIDEVDKIFKEVSEKRKIVIIRDIDFLKKKYVQSMKHKIDEVYSNKLTMYNLLYHEDTKYSYKEKYEIIKNKAEEAKKKCSFSQLELEEIDGIVQEALEYKNKRSISELVKVDILFRNPSNFEEYFHNKEQLSELYKTIIEENECDAEQLEKANDIKKSADIDAQWIMRDLIAVMKDDCIDQITNKYVNSKEHQVAVFNTFVDTLKKYRDTFEEETDQFAVNAIKDLSYKSGLNYETLYGEEEEEEIKNPIDEIDNMEGIAFEKVCADVLSYNGFKNIKVTRGSGDQGIDVLAEKDGIKYAIQCKRYSNKLGNTPIQEVHAGKKYYKCQIGVVMTNSYFTKGAVELAEETGTLLWDRDKLIEMIGKRDKE